MANQPNFIPSAFAASGDKNTIPASDGGTGAASFAAGFPPKTALPLNAGGVAPDRKDFNGIFNILSQFAEFQQSGGTFGYSATQDYTKGAVVTDGSTGALYVCILANGPGTSAGVKALTNASYWRRLMDASTVMTGATSSTAGAAGVVPAPAAGSQGKTLLGDGTWGQDADIAAAKAAGQIGGAYYVTSDPDLDNYVTAGVFYFGTSLTLVNAPPGCTYGYLTVSAVNPASPTTQRFVQSANRMYVRTKANGTAPWSSWVRESTDVDIMTGATSSTAGAAGLVPTPAAGQQGKTLLGSGTWGQDPDIVAAKASGQIGNAVYVTSDFDLNNYTTQGNYYFGTGNAIVNGPPGVTYGYLTVTNINSLSPTVQRFVQSASIIYMRSRPDGSSPWSSWTKEMIDLDVMAGATSSANGSKGLVPAPQAGEQAKYLLGDGTWGKDADVVAAIAANQIGNVPYVDNTITAPDLDNYTTSGVYLFSSAQVSGGSHFPLASGIMWLWVTSYTSVSPSRQIASGVASKVYYERHRAGATWSAWTIISFPFPQTSTGAGQWTAIQGGTWDTSNGQISAPGACVLPANGTWGYFVNEYFNGGSFRAHYAGVAAGGTTIVASTAGNYSAGFAWRIA